MRVAVCLSIDQGRLLGGHNSVEAGGRKGRGSDNESNEAQLPKNKVSVRKEVESEEHHSAAEGIYRSRRKECRCKATDSRAMGLVALWYVEARLPWSHRSLALMEGEHWNFGLIQECSTKERSRQYVGTVSFLLRGVGGKSDGKDGTIPKKFNGSGKANHSS
ncbi:hypothetical protein BHE74_00055344 [Ensete ventricosum]|nr:hypothetical protein BHE74_00055344 [Ensete ventricosum]